MFEIIYRLRLFNECQAKGQAPKHCNALPYKRLLLHLSARSSRCSMGFWVT